MNIHLFHDPSNLIALNSTPSIYSEYRRRALEYSIKKIKSNQCAGETSHIAVFGDFNFRLDLASLIEVNFAILISGYHIDSIKLMIRVKNYANKKDSIEIKDHNNKLLRLVYKLEDQVLFQI